MKSLVLCSGGIKSTFLTIEATKDSDVTLLFIDYGQPARAQERAAVYAIAERIKRPVVVTKAQGFPSLHEPLLRFLCFFCHAAITARQLDCPKIYHGLSRDDIANINDPKLAEEFVTGLQRLLDMSLPNYDHAGLWLGDLEVDTPLRRLRMEHILRLGNEWRISWAQTWSCLCGLTHHCGECTRCLRRKRAFKREANKEDPTYYLAT